MATLDRVAFPFCGEARMGPLRCLCCGQPEHTQGCVRGFTCDCMAAAGLFMMEVCFRCRKCPTHCACAEGWQSWDEGMAAKKRALGIPSVLDIPAATDLWPE